jgi:hypothetical protein
MDENITCRGYFHRTQKTLSQPEDIFAEAPKGIPLYINKYTLPWFKVLKSPERKFGKARNFGTEM